MSLNDSRKLGELLEKAMLIERGFKQSAEVLEKKVKHARRETLLGDSLRLVKGSSFAWEDGEPAEEHSVTA